MAGNVFAEETFQEVRESIEIVAKRFKRRFGGDYEEIMDRAYYFYCLGYDDYNYEDHGKVPFDKWICRYVHLKLLNAWRTFDLHWEWRKDKRVPVESAVIHDDPTNGECILDVLSPDAKEVVLLTLDPPKQLKFNILIKGGYPTSYRSSIREHLLNLGWTTSRITESFKEIGKALA
jgi:hypothetical protein